MKKLKSIVALAAVLFFIAGLFPTVPADSIAYDPDYRFVADKGLSASDIEMSEVKPVLTLTKEVITLEEAKANPTRQVDLSVSGANGKYATTGLHIYYDSRLTCEEDSLSLSDVKIGSAAQSLASADPQVDLTAADLGMKGVFLATGGSKNRGGDGIFFSINLKLPNNAAKGDVFPLDIIYRSDNYNFDLFTNAELDEAGDLIQAYTFTRGIYNREYNYNFSASDEDIARCAALADIDRSYDGYIAIADNIPIPVTTTAIKTTTTRATTTTKATTTTAKATAVSTSYVKFYSDKYPPDGGFTAVEIESSEVKPVLTLTKEVITLDEAKANPERQVALSVSGADGKYVSTTFDIYYDSRLNCAVDGLGMLDVEKGAATEYLLTDVIAIENIENPYTERPTYNGMNGVVLLTAGSANRGRDGVLFTINLTLPNDAAEGDVYPIDIVYWSNDYNCDLFTNAELDEAGDLMQAYTFTRGIYNKEYNNNFTASAEDIAKCSALANIDGSYDGYIAIADKKTSAPITLFGDANEDGKVSMADATAILQHIGNSDKYGLKEQGIINADVVGNGDGITGEDALAVQMVDAKLLLQTELPIPSIPV